MKEVGTLTGCTQKHDFEVVVSHDSKTNEFVAELHVSSPPDWVTVPEECPEDPGEFRDASLFELRDHIEQWINKHCGEIVRYDKKDPWSLEL